jgi:hypothetical protein
MGIDVLDVLNRAISNVDPAMSTEHAAWRSELRAAHTAIGNLINAANVLGYTLHAHGNWDDGCFYYGGHSATELEYPLKQLDATIEAAQGGKSDG